MIEPGLTRITRLLQNIPVPWRAIHVAGTNGKGSVCAYASAMLHASNIKCGRFTSPHLIDRWDCISINDDIVDRDLFSEVEDAMKANSYRNGIAASEFELLTATAFEIFSRKKVEVGVVEVGMGGRLDATNVLQKPAVTVITKVGQDHQDYLGETLEAIAGHKAGIMKPRVPCLVDGTNLPIVIETLRRNAESILASPFLLISHDMAQTDNELEKFLDGRKLEPHQLINTRLAIQAVQVTLAQMNRSVSSKQLMTGIDKTFWPGRLQMINLRHLISHKADILLDGAHNPQSATVLGSYVDSRLRKHDLPVTWVIGITNGKDAKALLFKLLRPGDSLIAVSTRPVDGMPWVTAMEPDDIIEAGRAILPKSQMLLSSQDLPNALRIAAASAGHGRIVITGSLYLVSDTLRWLGSSS